MISRRNYVIIVIVMGIIFFLFQFSQFVRTINTDYNINKYKEIDVPDNNPWQQTVLKIGDEAGFEGDDYILFVGETDSNVGSIVGQWTLYTKRDLLVCDSITSFKNETYAKPEFLLVDSKCVDFEKETQLLSEIVGEGVYIVFCNLPDVEVIEKNAELQKLLGISQIKEKSVTVEGIKLFSGFLLGGEEIYQPKKKTEEQRQDLDLTMPWYITAGGTKTYMVGLMDDYYEDYEYKNEFYPAIIWRNSLGTGQVFCVNGDYMSETTGLGILSSMIYELSTYQLYPVVNAQNTLVVDFPLMADENDETINRLYSRSLNSLQTEVIWPSLISLAEKNDLKYTCFIAPKYNYSDPAKPQYENYNMLLQLFNERDTELGLSLNHAPGISLLDKLSYDKDYYDGIENRYESTGAFMDLSDADELDEAVKVAYVRNVRTIACDEDIRLPILSYLTEDITLQSLTSNTKNFTYSRDLMLRSIETVLGYDNAKLNLSDVAWPESEMDQWENIFNDMGSSLATYWKKFEVFERTTLTESDQRVRTFLNIDSSSEREGDEITLHVSGTQGETCWFILRTHGAKIDKIQGATYEKIEENAYLLTISEETVVIDLKSTRDINK